MRHLEGSNPRISGLSCTPSLALALPLLGLQLLDQQM